jgi:HEAT repeat protein
MKTFVRLSGLFAGTAIAFVWLTASRAAPEETAPDPDERYLRDLKIPTDTAGLIAYLRERSNADDDLQNIGKLITQLGDKNFDVRQKAEERLKKVGLPALPALRAAIKDPDQAQEVVRRSRSCIEEIAKESNWSPPRVAARLLTRRNKAESVEVLLRYLPYIGADEATEEAIWFGVDALAERDRKVCKLLTPSLQDPLAPRRALAACILCRLGDEQEKAKAKRLLGDRQTTVRLRAAQGLLAGKDKAAVPVLIELLDEAPVYEAWEAEELLRWLAGENAPDATLGIASKERRKTCKNAWQAWWQINREKLEVTGLAKDHRRPGLLLISEPSGIWLCGCDGKKRWECKSSKEVTDLHLLPGDRILLAESADGSPVVRERSLTGEVLWQAKAPRLEGRVRSIRRLPNDATFVGAGSEVLEVAWNDETIYCHNLENIGVYRLSRGSILHLSPKSIAELDCTSLRQIGKEIAIPWKSAVNGVTVEVVVYSLGTMLAKKRETGAAASGSAC